MDALLKFHLDNVLMIGPREKYQFIREKTRVATRRMRLRTRTAFTKLADMFRQSSNPSPPRTNTKAINDRAQSDYIPEAYPARITLFRPEKNFSAMDNYHFGWDELAERGVEVHTLPVRPKGMLVEPFVRTLAEEVTACIDRAQETTDRTPEEADLITV